MTFDELVSVCSLRRPVKFKCLPPPSLFYAKAVFIISAYPVYVYGAWNYDIEASWYSCHNKLFDKETIETKMLFGNWTRALESSGCYTFQRNQPQAVAKSHTDLGWVNRPVRIRSKSIERKENRCSIQSAWCLSHDRANEQEKDGEIRWQADAWLMLARADSRYCEDHEGLLK